MQDGLAVRSSRSAASDDAGRIDFVDGLRGVAISLVILTHAFAYSPSNAITTGHGVIAHALNYIAGQGTQGVSLFLVISGFCLSYPLLKRRRAAVQRWFVPSEFFARRALRILPPYYVALAVFVLAAAILAHLSTKAADIVGPPPNAVNLISHVLLIHNLTSYEYAINNAFWSLGLEWQWYWFFPLMLLLCIRSPWLAAVACVVMASVWYVGTHDLWDRGALPVRLFEFYCGIVAARIIVGERSVSQPLLVCGVVIPLLLAQLSGLQHHVALSIILTLGLAQPLYGIGFASLLLLGYHGGTVRAALSWRPLVWLGIASYSIYLIHLPVILALGDIAPRFLRHSPLFLLAAIICGIAVGAAFHIGVERPFQRRHVYERVAPILRRMLGWTDVIWARVRFSGSEI